MEKIIFALWRRSGETTKGFNLRLREQVAPELEELTAAIRLNLCDEHVSNGNSPRMASQQPQMDAVIQIWLDSAHDKCRVPVEDLLEKSAFRIAAWLVCESTVLPNTIHPPKSGQRTEGFSQLAFLGKPPRLNWQSWRDIWQRDHTDVAIKTQSTFEYVQNLVVRPLSYNAPNCAAVVEECFPIDALNDQSVYFDARENNDRLVKNQQRMAESCARFIDFDRIDCIPTSQYEIKTVR